MQWNLRPVIFGIKRKMCLDPELRVVFPLRGPGHPPGLGSPKNGEKLQNSPYKIPLRSPTPENGENCTKKGEESLRRCNFCNFSVFSLFSGVGLGRGIFLISPHFSGISALEPQAWKNNSQIWRPWPERPFEPSPQHLENLQLRNLSQDLWVTLLKSLYPVRPYKFMCSPRNTGNINFSLWLTGGLSQGCPDFQKVYVFKVYVPFS